VPNGVSASLQQTAGRRRIPDSIPTLASVSARVPDHAMALTAAEATSNDVPVHRRASVRL
jgi:hypothetical protein